MPYTDNFGLTTSKNGRTDSSEFAADMSTLRSRIGSGTVSYGGYTGTSVDDTVGRYRAAHPGDNAGLRSFIQGLAGAYDVTL